MRFIRSFPLLFSLLLFSFLLLLSACTLALPLQVATLSAGELTPVDLFTARLRHAVVQRDFNQLQRFMGKPFVMAEWQAAHKALPPEVAIVQLRNTYLSTGSGVTLTTDVDWQALLGTPEPLRLADAKGEAAGALYVTGLGDNQKAEAVLIVAQQADGTPYWHSMLVAAGGFHAKTNVALGRETLKATVADATLSDEGETTSVMADATGVQRLRFDESLTAATVHGVIQPQTQQIYLLRALAGQRLIVEVASPGGQAYFTLQEADNAEAQMPLVAESRHWSGSVPTTQDYLITVAAQTATPFQLVATLDPRQSSSAPQPAPIRVLFAAGATSTTITGQAPAPERHRYLVRATAGQTLTVDLLPAEMGVTFAVQGVTDGLPLKRLETGAAHWTAQAPLTQDYLITVVAPGEPVDYTLQVALQ